jgi:hypothetical protein
MAKWQKRRELRKTQQYNSPLSAIAKIISKHAVICALLLFLSMITLFVFIALGIQI